MPGADQIYPHLSQAAVFICEVFRVMRKTHMFLFFGKVRESLGKGGGDGQEAGNSESSTQAAFPSVPNYLFWRIKICIKQGFAPTDHC